MKLIILSVEKVFFIQFAPNKRSKNGFNMSGIRYPEDNYIKDNIKIPYEIVLTL